MENTVQNNKNRKTELKNSKCMDKQTVWIDLSDRAYEKRLSEFLVRHYGNYLDIREETLKGAVIVPEKLVLLTDEAYSDKELSPLREGLGRVLLMSPVEGLDPYQSAHEIARAIFQAALEVGKPEEAAVSEAAEAEETAAVPQTKRICVVTATSGGLGGGTLARALTAEWTQRGRTLFLDLSERSPWQLYEKTAAESRDLSDVFYSLAAEPATMWEKRLMEACEKQAGGYWFAKPCGDPEDWLSLTSQEADAFCEVLLGAFDIVVADTGHWVSSPVRRMMEHSHEICVLTSRREEDALALSHQALPEGVCWTFIRELPGTEVVKGKGQSLLKGKGGKEEDTVFSLPETPDLWEVRDGIRLLKRDSAFMERIKEAVRTMG